MKASVNQILSRGNAIQLPAKMFRLLLYIGLTVMTWLTGIYMMYAILCANGTTALAALSLIFFAISFCWIATAFWSAIFGFVLVMLGRDPLTLQATAKHTFDTLQILQRTAIVMPIYNENTQRVIAGFEATLNSLLATGEIEHFDFYLLSDTTDLAIAECEREAWLQFTNRVGDLKKHIFYRRREKNYQRKVGNIADFLQRWGSNYEYMVLMDADSIMSGACLLRLVRTMQGNPRCGLIQTVPVPVRQTTFFGRYVQFAAILYSPMLATGNAFWQTSAANYWGHNAIVRVQAFINHCGLPTLSGKAPFGGDILSHDFVEAALLRRAGWDVFLLPDIAGSYEEVPCNIIDFATRDRRWAQGNIQHLGLLNAGGLHPVSRLHFLLGATAYIISLVWACMLILSTADAFIRSLNSKPYFIKIINTLEFRQINIDWTIIKTDLIENLIILTVALLILPKLLGVVATLTHRRKQFGGTRAILLGALIEVIFAILIAPIMMIYHAFFVVAVLMGFEVKWDTQEREGRLLSWRESFARTAKMSLVGLIWGAATYACAPMFFWWLTPILFGIVFAAPIVRYSSSLELGTKSKLLDIFITPDETNEDPVLTDLQRLLTATDLVSLPSESFTETGLTLPPVNWREMPIQEMKIAPTIGHLRPPATKMDWPQAAKSEVHEQHPF